MADVKNKKAFEVEVETEKDGVKTKSKLKLASVRPSAKVLAEADTVRAAAFGKYLRAGAVLKQEVAARTREAGLDERYKAELEAIRGRIDADTDLFTADGVDPADGREAALRVRDARAEFSRLNAERFSAESNTAEGMADNARLQFLVAACTVHADTGKPFWKTVDDYLASDSPAAGPAANALLELLYGVGETDQLEAEKKLPENIFLYENGFVDDKLRLVNADGHLTDRDGRLIREDGRYVSPKGELVDRDGRPVDEDGNRVRPKPKSA